MPIQIESTTDSKEAVTAAMGDLANQTIETVVDPKAATEANTALAKTTEDSANSDVEKSAAQKAEEEDPAAEKPGKKGGFQKKIGKLTKQREDARAQAEFWKQEAIKLQKGPSSEKPATVEVKTPGDKSAKPKSEDFNSHEEFIEALTDWKVDQKEATKTAKSREDQLRSEMDTKNAKFATQVKEFSVKHDDFKEVMEDIDDINMSLAVQAAVLDSDNSAELMYALAKNREEYEAICKLPAIAAARAIGRFEAKHITPAASASETTAVKTTKAPPPISPVGTKTTGSGKKSIDDPNLSQREFEQIREEQLAQKRA